MKSSQRSHYNKCFRPKQMAPSLPATLAAVPMRSSPVATKAGESTAAALAPVVAATHARKATTPSAQRAHFQRVDAVGPSRHDQPWRHHLRVYAAVIPTS